MSRLAAWRVNTSMDRELELRLVSELRRGDPAAFDAVYDAFNARLYNFLARLSNSRDIADDLLEETWLRLVTHAARLNPDTRLGPWLFTVARRLYVSYRRSRFVEDSHAAGLLGLWPSGAACPSPLDVVEATENRQRLATAFASLPPTYREALLLVIEGLGAAEAADVCGTTPEAMRQRVSRARTLLARRLADEEHPCLSPLKEATS